MRTLYKILGLAVAILATPLVKAETLDFTITGSGSTYTFSLDSNPTPDAFSTGASFTLDNVPVNVDNQFGQTSNIQFFNSSQNGGLELVDLAGLLLQGDQLYTGAEASPAFRTGTFDLSGANETSFSLTIAPETTSVPEPGTLLLLGTGALATLNAIRRKRTA